MKIKMVVHRIEQGAGLVPVVDVEGKMAAARGCLTTIELVPQHHENDLSHPNANLFFASPGGQVRVTIDSLIADAFGLRPDQEVLVSIERYADKPGDTPESSPIDAPAGELEPLPAGLLPSGEEALPPDGNEDPPAQE